MKAPIPGSTRHANWLVLAVVALLAFAFQGDRGLWGPDEGRYSNVALQMVQSGDWLIPRRHAEHTHFSKPPLTYWAIAASVKVFGENEWALRLPAALALCGTGGVLLLLGRLLVPMRPWLPPLVYATSLLPFFAGNLISTDGLLSCFEALAMLGFVHLWLGADPRSAERLELMRPASARRLLWLGFALAFMTKGPPGLLPLLAMWVFLWLERRHARVIGGTREFRAPRGGPGEVRLVSLDSLALFALIALPWFIAVAIRVPGLLGYLLGNEVVARVLTDTHDRNPQWYAPFTIYLPVLLFATLPWGVVLWRRLPTAVRALRARGRAAWFDLAADQRLLWCWVGVPLLVFSLARSRLQLYLLPLFVPIALLVARALQDWVIRRPQLGRMTIWVLLLLGLKLVAGEIHYAKDTRAIADQVRASWQARPVEIIFVEEPALYGLRHYLGLQIERVSFAGPVDGAFDETLAEEIADAEGPRLWVTTPDRVERLRQIAAAQGQRYVPFGQHDRYVLGTMEPRRAAAPGAELALHPEDADIAAAVKQ